MSAQGNPGLLYKYPYTCFSSAFQPSGMGSGVKQENRRGKKRKRDGHSELLAHRLALRLWYDRSRTCLTSHQCRVSRGQQLGTTTCQNIGFLATDDSAVPSAPSKHQALSSISIPWHSTTKTRSNPVRRISFCPSLGMKPDASQPIWTQHPAKSARSLGWTETDFQVDPGNSSVPYLGYRLIFVVQVSRKNQDIAWEGIAE